MALPGVEPMKCQVRTWEGYFMCTMYRQHKCIFKKYVYFFFSGCVREDLKRNVPECISKLFSLFCLTKKRETWSSVTKITNLLLKTQPGVTNMVNAGTRSSQRTTTVATTGLLQKSITWCAASKVFLCLTCWSRCKNSLMINVFTWMSVNNTDWTLFL